MHMKNLVNYLAEKKSEVKVVNRVLTKLAHLGARASLGNKRSSKLMGEFKVYRMALAAKMAKADSEK